MERVLSVRTLATALRHNDKVHFGIDHGFTLLWSSRKLIWWALIAKNLRYILRCLTHYGGRIVSEHCKSPIGYRWLLLATTQLWMIIGSSTLSYFEMLCQLWEEDSVSNFWVARGYQIPPRHVEKYWNNRPSKKSNFGVFYIKYNCVQYCFWK